MMFVLVYPMLICTAVNNERYLGLHVECPILPYFKQIWSFLTDFNSSTQYQISQKSVPWRKCRYMWTDKQDRYDENNKLMGAFRCLCEHTKTAKR